MAASQLIERDDVENFGDRDRQNLRSPGSNAMGSNAVAAREILRNELERIGVDDHLRQLDRFLADGPRHDVADDRFCNEAQPYQQPADRRLLDFLLGEGDAQLIRGNEPLLNQ